MNRILYTHVYVYKTKDYNLIIKMNFFTNLFDINPSTLSGSVDIIAIR